jgi:hypothetical protein
MVKVDFIPEYQHDHKLIAKLCENTINQWTENNDQLVHHTTDGAYVMSSDKNGLNGKLLSS